MDFIDQIKTIAQNIEKIKGGALNEQATKYGSVAKRRDKGKKSRLTLD